MQYVQGFKDDKKRRVIDIPAHGESTSTFRGSHHRLMMLELSPGQWVKQVIAESRIRKEEQK